MGGWIPVPARADIRLPRVVSDHMVLQRDSRVLFWGWADPGERIHVHLLDKQAATTANWLGQWSVWLGPFPPGGPYDITVQGKNTLKVRDVLIGDVWVASGQSNMEFPVQAGGEWTRGVLNADHEVSAAHFPRLRLFQVARFAALNPADDVPSRDGWQAVTPESVGNFSAVAYFFGRELHQRYQIPIGMIEASWGGTVAEAWISAPALQPFSEFRPDIEAMSQVTDKARTDYEQYVRATEAWKWNQRAEDRGRVNGRAVWADPSFDTSSWPTIQIPRPESTCGKELDGFRGVLWLRRTLSIPAQRIDRELSLHLGNVVAENDVTYFNGDEIGHSEGVDTARNYAVPRKAVRAGENTIVVRLEVRSADIPCVGIYSPADQLWMDVGPSSVSLAGPWAYQLGPELHEMPMADDRTLAGNLSPNGDRPRPTVLFNGMVHPLLRYRIKGVIWYQGEANANRPTQYRTLFPALINDWRTHWGYPFPFLFVQLAGFGPEQPQSADCPWAELREAQSMALRLPGTGMATAVDVGDAEDIHPRDKQSVARRLVLVAARVAYGEHIVDSGPKYETLHIEGNRIRIRFSDTGKGLHVKDKYGYVRGFEIAGPDGKFVWAQARPDGQDILVFSDVIERPVAVRYDWGNTPDGNLYNEEGLPALPFRTDGPKP